MKPGKQRKRIEMPTTIEPSNEQETRANGIWSELVIGLKQIYDRESMAASRYMALYR